MGSQIAADRIVAALAALGLAASVAHGMYVRRVTTQFAARALRFCGESDADIFAALACWCRGVAWCPRTARMQTELRRRRAASYAVTTYSPLDAAYRRADLAAVALHSTAGMCRAVAVEPVQNRLDVQGVPRRATRARYVVTELWRGAP